MTAQQYLEQNAKGFEGDGILREVVRETIDRHNIHVVVETGTYMGATTIQLAQMCDNVYTVEVNAGYQQTAMENIKKAMVPNIQMFLGSSGEMLPDVLHKAAQHMLTQYDMFILLDAHWGDNNPLLQELHHIAEANIKPIIAIHDFKVPGYPELGFDSYNGQDYEWEWIKEAVEGIYGQDYLVQYNSAAEGAKRGVIFIQPK